MKRYLLAILLVTTLILSTFTLTTPAIAQEEEPIDLLLFTKFPAQVTGIGENVTFDLSILTETEPQSVDLEIQDLPEGWTASFKGGSKIVQAVFAQPKKEVSFDLKLELPQDVKPGTYEFTVIARSNQAVSRLPLKVIVQEKVPANLAFEVELPTLRGKPDKTFRYNVTLKNDGDEDLAVDLLAEAPAGFIVTFKSSGQEVTNLPIEANSSKRISVEADPVFALEAGSYPIVVRARGGETEAMITLTAEVVGQSDLVLTTADGRLSGQAEAGAETSYNLVIKNNGTATAQGITLSATEPSGWNVTFEPEFVEEVAPGEQVEIKAKVRPAEKAIAGDYMLTFRIQPENGATESIDYRVTVRTSTLWGIAGVGLIAIAVGVVGLAVMRFGRR